MARKDSENQKKFMSRVFCGKEIPEYGMDRLHVACVREWVANIFHTKNGKTIMVDAGYNYERLGEKYWGGWILIRHRSYYL